MHNSQFDLHGMTAHQTNIFLKQSIFNNKNAKKSYKLIIGKGNHSSNGPVLGGYIRNLVKEANNLNKNNVSKWYFYWIIYSIKEGVMIIKKK